VEFANPVCCLSLSFTTITFIMFKFKFHLAFMFIFGLGAIQVYSQFKLFTFIIQGHIPLK